MLEQKYIDRFWTYVKIEGPDDCWEWIGARSKTRGKGINAGLPAHGYFNVKLNGKFKQIGAHKVSLMIQGITISSGMVVMHSCDNPSCVNPNHLRLGTYKDNTHDMIRKGRSNFHGRAVITEDLAKQIKSEIVIITDIPGRKTRKTNIPALARKYNVSVSTVAFIANGRSWKHV